MKQNRKILVIDDEASIRRFLKVSLEHAGYTVDEASSAKDGIREVIAFKPDIVILDLGLPDRDGIEVIKNIRKWSHVAIVVLTVREDEENKVQALDAGADDYLTKPFGIPELLARLRVAERHSILPTDGETHFSSGQLEVDLLARLVHVMEKEVHLTVTEFGILRLLIKHAGQVVTHRQILNEIWGPNATEHTQYLRVYMGHLRRKIESDSCPEPLIITELGVGYRLLKR